MPKTTYKVRIENDVLEVGIPDFYERNQALAIAYKTENEPQAKNEIAGKIFKICEPILKAWKIIDPYDKEDFKQDCFFQTLMALDSFEPNKGAFVSWLKGYINGKRNKSLPGSKQNKKDDAPLYNREIPISRLDNDDSRFDSHRQPWDEGSEETHGFGKDMLRAKSLIGEERFELVRKRVILGMTYDEISAETDLTIPVIKKKLSRAYDALRTATALNINSGALLTHMEDGSIFLTIKQLALRLDKKEEQIYKEAKGIYRTQYRINPLHILKIGKEMRFRYKLSPKGLEYPEFIFQGNKNPKYMSKVARKQRDK